MTRPLTVWLFRNYEGKSSTVLEVKSPMFLYESLKEQLEATNNLPKTQCWSQQSMDVIESDMVWLFLMADITRRSRRA